MIGIVLALLAALAYSFSVVLIRKSLDESDFLSPALVLAVIGNIIFWPLSLLFTNLRTVNLEGVLFFAIAGILAPGIVRLLYFKGMEVVGVSVTASALATFPMYSSIFAVLLLSEVLISENWIGILCIVIGVVYMERSVSKPKTGPKKIFKKGLVFPLLGSLTLAFSYIARKHALNIFNEPLLGGAIGYSLSLLLYIVVLISFRTTQNPMFLRKNFRLFWKAGACSSVGWILGFYALSHERVSIVTPLIQTQPLFVLILTHLYLKELEHISLELIISTLLIVIGVMLVSIR